MSQVDEVAVTDSYLLEQWRAGCGEAGEALLKSYFPVLYRFFSNKVSADVDDLVQQTMMALAAGRDQFENRSSFRSYLLSIARFQLYEYVRRRQRTNAHLEFDTVTAFDLSPSPSTMAVARAEKQALLEALRRIPLNFQIALELHYWEDLSGPELAEALGVPLDTAYSRVRKARELVKKQLRVLAAGLGDTRPRDADDQDSDWETALRSAPKA
jgi:RNA polymerase sigma factor (sigma-70 family)